MDFGPSIELSIPSGDILTNPLVLLGIFLLIFIIGLVVLIFLVRGYFHKHGKVKAAFKKNILLVTLPKFEGGTLDKAAR